MSNKRSKRLLSKCGLPFFIIKCVTSGMEIVTISPWPLSSRHIGKHMSCEQQGLDCWEFRRYNPSCFFSTALTKCLGGRVHCPTPAGKPQPCKARNTAFLDIVNESYPAYLCSKARSKQSVRFAKVAFGKRKFGIKAIWLTHQMRQKLESPVILDNSSSVIRVAN